jgi:hypothetical protein
MLTLEDSKIGNAVVEKIFLHTSIFIEFARIGGGQYLQILENVASHYSLLITSSMIVFEFWQGRSLNDPATLHEQKCFFQRKL